MSFEQPGLYLKQEMLGRKEKPKSNTFERGGQTFEFKQESPDEKYNGQEITAFEDVGRRIEVGQEIEVNDKLVGMGIPEGSKGIVTKIEVPTDLPLKPGEHKKVHTSDLFYVKFEGDNVVSKLPIWIKMKEIKFRD